MFENSFEDKLRLLVESLLGKELRLGADAEMSGGFRYFWGVWEVVIWN